MKISMFQYTSGKPLTFLSDYMHNTPQKGIYMLPKWALDVDKHEVDRCVRLTNGQTIEYVSFRLPNRTGQFQEELYPPFPSNKPANSYGEWASGQDK